ncbi:MAG TPA: 1-acyl-sn-glycerol-3-phosphate acyltransferase, partial [Solirubrobacteraceae bacterium]|nr:1-acyl-sn-glycerol-3-phosphate acyltransferase [Solirubrobacteraceae bacterium]
LYLDRVDRRGVNPLVYWVTRAVFQLFFHVWFRMSRIGREHIPARGPVILAANHRSFLDPFVIGTMVRRPVYYMAKRELFSHRLVAWYLNNLGAFPIDRGKGDEEAMAAARAILERGDCVVVFPEGSRTRPGGLGAPRRGVGRLALETAAPVVPIAVIGTEAVRRGWRFRPHKVRLRAGRPLTFPRVEEPSPQLAAAVTERIWPCVALQWEWLGGTPPLRRAAVIGAGSWGTALAVALARAGVEVELGCRTQGQAQRLGATRGNDDYLRGVALPAAVRPLACERLDLAAADLVVLAVPSRELPVALAAHGGQIPRRTGVLVLAKGLVAPASPAAAQVPAIGPAAAGEAPSDYVAAHTTARAVACLGGPGHAADALTNGACLVVASRDSAFGHQVRAALRAAGLDAEVDADVTGVELAGVAKNAAALAAAAAGVRGPNAAGAAAGKVFAEVAALAERRGGRLGSFTGLAGAGDLVATVLAHGSRNRRAGELLAGGLPAERVGDELGQEAEAVHTIGLLAAAARDAGLRAPALDGLARMIDGELEPERWAATVTAPQASRAA